MSNKEDEIRKHIADINVHDEQDGSGDVIQKIAKQYDVSEEYVRQIIAEWSAGHDKSVNASSSEKN